MEGKLEITLEFDKTTKNTVLFRETECFSGKAGSSASDPVEKGIGALYVQKDALEAAGIGHGVIHLTIEAVEKGNNGKD